MLYTCVVYGFRLGGPGQWNLTGFSPGDQLRTAWYDEQNPTHDFAERATKEITGPASTATGRVSHEPYLPFTFDTAVELSPPGWTKEASAPPTPSYLLSPSLSGPALDEPAPSRFVLLINDSATVVEDLGYAPEHGLGDSDRIWDHRIDWDSVLDAALAELGLQAPTMPDWFWYRGGTG
ncbi:hypothetical protein AB0B31_11215 [Catellatospora citrea]|uniref:hypothetical protein n=1 Tax=Catellatospora citrea TaxID=53366 RepID=UPI0033F53BC0